MRPIDDSAVVGYTEHWTDWVHIALERANVLAMLLFAALATRALARAPGRVGRAVKAFLDRSWVDPRKTWVGREE
jgi:hypothetical protein